MLNKSFFITKLNLIRLKKIIQKILKKFYLNKYYCDCFNNFVFFQKEIYTFC
jgi:hypothetical protein